MKATKKIVGAACALVAAVALSAGSTFAWFASNSSVSATNMKVQAVVPTNIYIEKDYKATTQEVQQTTIDFDTDAANLAPAVISTQTETGGAVSEGKGGAVDGVETSDGKLYLYKDPALDSEDWTEKPEEGEVGIPSKLVSVSTFTPGKDSVEWSDALSLNHTNYVAAFDMTLANKSTPTDIYAKVTVTASVATDTCLFVRTGMLIGTQTASGGDMTYKFYSIENKAEGGTALTASGGELKYGKILSQMPRDTVSTITFLIWFDGQDADCMVNKASNVQEITFQIDFQTTDFAAAG